MTKIITILLSILFSFSMNAQVVEEICVSSQTNGTVVDCHFYQDSLYATGFFNIICGEPVGYIAKWDNNEWRPSSISITDPGHSLTTINDKLYIAKYEESIDSNWVLSYDGSEITRIGKGVYLTTASGFSELPNIYDIIEFNGNLIACGEFDKVGDEFIHGIMQWNGSSWSEMSSGLDGNINGTAPVMFPHQMIVQDSNLYVVGNFKNAGEVEVNGIAKWDGENWTNMGDGFNGTVYGITVFENEIIVGGSFTASGQTSLNRIAKWNGTEWQALDFGFSQSSPNDFIFVHTLRVIDDELFIGGGLKEIEYADGTKEICNGIVSYSNNQVNTYMDGVPGFDIEAICPLDGNQILVGGGVFGNGFSGIIDLNPSSIKENQNQNVLIKPNPFYGSFDIETLGINYEEYELRNELGKLISNGPFKNKFELNLNPGVYFLSLLNKRKVESIHKIISL